MTQTMQAAFFRRPDQLEAGGVSRGNFPARNMPLITGHEFAGVIDAVRCWR